MSSKEFNFEFSQISHICLSLKLEDHSDFLQQLFQFLLSILVSWHLSYPPAFFLASKTIPSVKRNALFCAWAAEAFFDVQAVWEQEYEANLNLRSLLSWEEGYSWGKNSALGWTVCHRLCGLPLPSLISMPASSGRLPRLLHMISAPWRREGGKTMLGGRKFKGNIVGEENLQGRKLEPGALQTAA